MPVLTIQAKIIADPETKQVLLDAMQCATKVYNGLLWHLREEFKNTGKATITRQHLNAILKTLPRAKGYYSHSVQATRDEVIQAYRSFFRFAKSRQNPSSNAKIPAEKGVFSSSVF